MRTIIGLIINLLSELGLLLSEEGVGEGKEEMREGGRKVDAEKTFDFSDVGITVLSLQLRKQKISRSH